MNGNDLFNTIYCLLDNRESKLLCNSYSIFYDREYNGFEILCNACECKTYDDYLKEDLVICGVLSYNELKCYYDGLYNDATFLGLHYKHRPFGYPDFSVELEKTDWIMEELKGYLWK